MSFGKNPTAKANPTEELPPPLPKVVAEVKSCLKNPELALGLLKRIREEPDQKVRWAGRHPVCARELVLTLFSKAKLEQVIAPFFSLCAMDPALAKALLNMGSHPTSDKQSKQIHETLEKNIQVLAQNPKIFFSLGIKALESNNRLLVLALLNYCKNDPDFVKMNVNLFTVLIKQVLRLENLVILGDILERDLDRFLDQEAFTHPLNPSVLFTLQKWHILDLLIQTGRASSMKCSNLIIEEGKNPEKLDLLIANGATMNERPYWDNYRPPKKQHMEKAYASYQMYKKLHSPDLSVECLRAQNPKDLWTWISLDRNAASILTKYPDFFKEFLLQQSDYPTSFDQALGAYIAAGCFDPTQMGIPLLFKAIALNRCDVVKALIHCGVSAYAINPQNGQSTFEAALRSLNREPTQNLELFYFFLNHPATDCRALFKYGSHPIDALVLGYDLQNKHEPLKAMLDKGFVLTGLRLSLRDKILSMKPYEVPALKLLISKGISLSEQDADGNSLLHTLILFYTKAPQAECEMFLHLIRHIAFHDPKHFNSCVNTSGQTVLDWAKALLLPEVALTLLQAGITQVSSCSESVPPNPSEKAMRIFMGAYKEIDKPTSLSELQSWITLTNLSYFFGDAISKYEVRGSNSGGGNSFNESASFLAVLLSFCETKWMGSEDSKEEALAVAKVRNKLEGAVYCFRVLWKCSENEEYRRRFLPVLSACYESQISALPPGETLLIPSGWAGHDGCYHAMLLEVLKNPDETCSLFVVNTDNKNGGLLHAHLPTDLKSLLNPIRAFIGIPLEKLLNSSLIPALLALLAHIPKDGTHKYTEEDYYHQLFWRFSDYATPLPPDKRSCFITAQRSGTCSMRCGLAYLHYSLGTKTYKKVKVEMEQPIFQAINDPSFDEKSSVNPLFLQHLEHGIERAALHLNKHKIDTEASLKYATEYTALLHGANQRMSGIAGSAEGSAWVKEVASEKTPPLHEAVAELNVSRQTFLPFDITPNRHDTPFPPLIPPNLNVGAHSSGEELMEAIDQLNTFFDKSPHYPLDPHQKVATHLTTQALKMLPLPQKGVFQPAIDEQTPMGSLSLHQKTIFQQSLGALCQKYATALYIQRDAVERKEARHYGYWSSGDFTAYTDVESVEQYLCINKLFAHYWRLSLALEPQETGPTSLCYYGIDISHLIALKESIHLPCYSPETAQQLNELIAFFQESHPDPERNDRTLLAIGSWAFDEKTIYLPLKNPRKEKSERFGDTLFFDGHYQKIPEKSWMTVDYKRNSLGGWEKPELKKWRLAHLFADPEAVQNNPSIECYHNLRKIAWTCWLFKIASHEEPIYCREVLWEKEKGQISTEFRALRGMENLADKAKKSSDPRSVGQLGHRCLLQQDIAALQRNTTQNDYTINNNQNARRFYEIAQPEEFSIHRLLAYYQENPSELKNGNDQTMFQLILFRKEWLSQAIAQDPSIGGQLLHVIELALQEFNVQLQANPAEANLLATIIFLNAIKLRLNVYLPGSFLDIEKQKLQQEISRRLEGTTETEPTAITPSNKAELLLLWICAQPTSFWTDLKHCEQAIVHLNQFEFLAAKLSGDDRSIDPTLKTLAYQTLFAHLSDLQKAFAHPEILFGAGRQICSAYGINISPKTPFEGTFPQISCVNDNHLYEIHLLSGIITRNKVSLTNPIQSMNSVIAEFSCGRQSPIEIHVLLRSDNATRFYGLSGGNEYYFTYHTLNQKEGQTQVEWVRSGETFYSIPFNTLPEKLKRIALASPPKKDNYYYWVSKDPSSSIAAIIQNRATGIEEVILYTDGTATLASEDGKWNYAHVESDLKLSALASMQPKEQIAVWQNSETITKVHCFGLKDSNGTPLNLQSRMPSGSLNIDNLPGYRLCHEQVVKGFGRHFPYLVVENEKGKRKALVPVKVWSEVVSDSKDVERSYLYEEIDIDQKGNPAPSEIKQRLLIAYYFIGSGKYDLALGMLKQSESSRVYTPEELKMLGWIFLHHGETKDFSPKATSLSLMAACFAMHNLENFPDAYPRCADNSKTVSFYAGPNDWAQFWKEGARLKIEANERKSVYACLGEKFARYYEVSSHCTHEFQIHDKLLTAFQEIQQLTQIVNHFRDPRYQPDFLLPLNHRLNFLTTGQVDPIVKEQNPKVAISVKINEKITEFNWLKLNPETEEFIPILSLLDRIRPESGFKKEFGKLYALATRGTPEEKEQLLHFLKDMQHDPDEINQLIRGILMSQLPPYNLGPTRGINYKGQTIPQAIAEKIRESVKEQQQAQETSYQRYYNDYSPEKQLVGLVCRWQEYFFPSPDKCKINLTAPLSPPINFPPPPLQKKEKLCAQYTHSSDSLIAQMNAAAEDLFISEEKSFSTTPFPPLPKTLQQDPYFQMRGAALRGDIEEGKMQNHLKTRLCLKEKGEIAPLLSLQKDLCAKKGRLEAECKAHKKEIYALMSQVRGGRMRELEAQLLRLGKKDIPPTLDECISLFVKRDLNLYQQRMPFLNKEDCLQLNTRIGQYLLAATAEQRYARSLERVDKVISCSQKGKNIDRPVHNLALEMKKKREFSPSEHPEMLVLEYYDNISLRKEQCENFIKMTTTDLQGKFPPMLVQMIMSAGKTSVLGTLLALMKADGYHLSLLFTPRSLLDTNAPEMKQRNQSFFGQRGHTLTFNRGARYFNIPHLLKLQHTLLHAIEHREYLILAPETLLSMQNQYTEAREKVHSLRNQQRKSSPDKRQQFEDEIGKWETPAQELKKILYLIRKRGAPTFDEIDSQFSPRRELNYPGIETTRLDRMSVELVSALYEIASTDPDLKKAGLNLTENTQSSLILSQMNAIKPLLAQKMLQAIQENPIWCQHLGLGLVCDPEKIKGLADYFLNLSSQPPQWVAELNLGGENHQMAAERLVLIRQEIAQWLPSCWKHSANEHFSRSKEHPDYLAAKPNICASTPNESAEIAHSWELVNKTLQLYVSTGIDLNQTKTMIESLQKRAVIQARKIGADSVGSNQKKSPFDQTPVMQNFRKAAEKSGNPHLELLKLDVNDPEALRQAQKVLNAGTPESIHMIIQYLGEQVFPKLEFHKDQIHNNTANLSGAVDSEQGYSGTTDNPFIFSHTFMQDPEKRIVLDKGAYGRVIDVLCRSNRTIHTVGSHLKTPEDLMKEVHLPKAIEDRNRFHAFIDIGAYFKGYSNDKVASSFLNYFSSLNQSPIEGILYFDDTTNQLACIKKGQEKPILLSSTDSKTIFAMTGLKKEQRFTYFDQFHTRGANILHDPDAKAFYTIGSQTELSEKLQGDMRMRGLLEEQENEGIVPQDLIPLIFHQIEEPISEELSIQQILLFCEINGLHKDREDNLKAFSLKLNAAVRKYVLDKLYSSSIEEEEALYAVARNFFIRPMTEELFSQYGAPLQPMDADGYIAEQIQHFLDKILLIEPHLPNGKAEALKNELQEIASISKSYIPSKIAIQPLAENTTVENIADIEKKVDKLGELELVSHRDTSKNEKPHKAEEIPWSFDNLVDLLLELFSPLKGTNNSNQKFQKLSEVMIANDNYDVFSDAFTPEFLLSNNFIQTVSNQTNLFDTFQKTPYEALLFKPSDGPHLLLLLTAIEAKGFLKTLEKHKELLPFSLLNANGTVRAGAPIDPSQPDIELLIVQMLFFSGRLSMLGAQKWQRGLNNYLSVNRAMKRDLFEAIILEDRKFPDYEHSTLKHLLNAPSENPANTNPMFNELKAAFFALRRGKWMKCKESVEKHFKTLVNPETAVRDGKVMQGFNPESVPMGDTPSQKVKGSPIGTDSGSEDCVNLPSPTAVSRVKDHPEEISIVIDMVKNITQSFKSQDNFQWATDLLLEILPHLKSYATNHHYQPIKKVIEILQGPISDELKTQIFQTLLDITELPTKLLWDAYNVSTNFIIDGKTEVPKFVESLKNAMNLLSQFKENPAFNELVETGGKQLLQACFSNGNKISRYAAGDVLEKSGIAFESIMTLLREPKLVNLLLLFTKPFLTHYLDGMRTLHHDCIRSKAYDNLLDPSPTNKTACQFYADLKKYWAIHPELEQLFDELLIQPIIQASYKEGSETEGRWYWDNFVKALMETQIPCVMEQAENLRLKFESDDFELSLL